MIRIAVFLLVSLLAHPALAADADDRAARASACYTIINSDARTACLAKVHGDIG